MIISRIRQLFFLINKLKADKKPQMNKKRDLSRDINFNSLEFFHKKQFLNTLWLNLDIVMYILFLYYRWKRLLGSKEIPTARPRSANHYHELSYVDRICTKDCLGNPYRLINSHKQNMYSHSPNIGKWKCMFFTFGYCDQLMGRVNFLLGVIFLDNERKETIHEKIRNCFIIRNVSHLD